MASADDKGAEDDIVNDPLAKLNVLFAESGRVGARLDNQRQLATALGLSPSSLHEWCGPSHRLHGGRPKPAVLGQIARLFTARDIPVQPEWFYLDLNPFKQAVFGARHRNPRPYAEHDIAPSPSTEDWIVEDAEHLSQGLAALLIHPPPPANDLNTFQLRVSLSIALYPDEIEDQPILIGLKQAQIVPVCTACTATGRHPFPDVLRQSGLNDTVIGPKSPEGLLDGVALNNATLATMTFSRTEPPEIRLELHSRRSDLEVLEDDETRAISANKQKALQIFLQSCLHESAQGRVVWSRARLKRRDPHATD